MAITTGQALKGAQAFMAVFGQAVKSSGIEAFGESTELWKEFNRVLSVQLSGHAVDPKPVLKWLDTNQSLLQKELSDYQARFKTATTLISATMSFHECVAAVYHGHTGHYSLGEERNLTQRCIHLTPKADHSTVLNNIHLILQGSNVTPYDRAMAVKYQNYLESYLQDIYNYLRKGSFPAIHVHKLGIGFLNFLPFAVAGLAIGGIFLAGAIAPAIGSTAASISATAPASIAAPAAAGASTSAATTATVTASVGAAATSGASAVTNTTNSVVNTVSSAVNSTQSFVQSILGPITTAIDSVTTLARKIQDNLITPIVAPIETAYKSASGLIKSINTDLSKGLQGIVNIPGQIADALTSVDAQLQRSNNELGQRLTNIVVEDMVPKYETMASKPLGDLGDRLVPELPPNESLTPESVKAHLKQPIETLDVAEEVHVLAKAFSTGKGVFSFMGRWLSDFFVTGGYILSWIERLDELGKQALNISEPIEPLEANEAIEAFHRGFIDQPTLAADLRRQGIDEQRMKVMFQNSIFLYGVQDAANLYYRDLIPKEVFHKITAQNGMEQNEADFLLSLLSYLHSPMDAAVLFSRQLIDEPTYMNMQRVNKLSGDQAKAVMDLAQQPVIPRTLLKLFHIDQAVKEGLLESTLGSTVPIDILNAYKIAQQDPGQADIDWKSHWAVPNIDWWLQAYYRGIRTKNEVYAAAKLFGVPEELKDDIFTVGAVLISAFIMLTIFKAGVVTEENARAIMKQQGMLPSQIDILVAYAKAAGKKTKAQTADGLQKLSLGNAALLFENKVITPDEYSQILQDHGLEKPAADLTVQAEQLKFAISERKALATYIIDQAKLGLIDRMSAQTQLVNSGFTQDEVLKYLVELDRVKTVSLKMPTKAELDKMAKDGVIDQRTWENAMLQLNYDPKWIPLMWQIL